MKKLGLIAAFAATIAASSLVTSIVLQERLSRAQTAEGEKKDAPAATAPQVVVQGETWAISAYFVDVKSPTNGFVVVNQKTGKVSNCVANWQGKKDAKCYDWTSWAKLP